MPYRLALLALVILAAIPARAADPRAEEVAFHSGDLRLAGTLTLPEGAGPHPALVTIAGSGPQERDSALPGIEGYRPFADLAEHLAELGVAVLRYDERGVGASDGDNATATSGDLAEDVEAAIRHLQSRDDIDPLWIGLLGHSEGGMIAPMVAARHPGVAFVIALAPPVAEPLEGLVTQERRLYEAEGVPSDVVDAQVAVTRQVLELTRDAEWDALEALLRDTVREQLAALPEEQRAAFGDPEATVEALVQQTLIQHRGWIRFFLTYDVRPAWAALRVPALVVFAGRDVQVDEPMHRSALEEVAHADLVAVRTLPDANHLFQRAERGGVSEYAELPPYLMPGLYDVLDAWLERHVPSGE